MRGFFSWLPPAFVLCARAECDTHSEPQTKTGAHDTHAEPGVRIWRRRERLRLCVAPVFLSEGFGAVQADLRATEAAGEEHHAHGVLELLEGHAAAHLLDG